MTRRRGLGTVSLRHRVTFMVVAVLAVVLVALCAVLVKLINAGYNDGIDAMLSDRVEVAEELARAGRAPAELVGRIDGPRIQVDLRLADGRILRSSQIHTRTAEFVKLREVRLDGAGPLADARLELRFDATLLEEGRMRLQQAMAAAIGCGVLMTLVALPPAIRRALAPLDSMTALATGIARGRRGERLFPIRRDTELGRTAAAFDEMLDALEGAEARACASERRTRDFVADAAHELRTPVAGIGAIAEAILHGCDATPEERSRLELLLIRETRRAARLVDDLLDLARIDAGLTLYRAETEIFGLAQDQLDRIGLIRPDLVLSISGTRAKISADPQRISQVLANLLDNAGKVTPPGGRIAVTVGVHDAFVELVVADSGPGIRVGDRERIFDRLVRLDTARDNRVAGTGLGLSIARGIARAHGGDLFCIAPADGTGAAFVLRLPLTVSPDVGE
ncbi:sensor histidine kinase [Nocardia colli]|uniref:sensor histidine kinase n=1 Tax=Nocardia colli TaxID=2545717 RepID=UPI0035DAC723